MRRREGAYRDRSENSSCLRFIEASNLGRSHLVVNEYRRMSRESESSVSRSERTRVVEWDRDV